MNKKFVTFLIMGVAGAGKTTIAEKLCQKINANLGVFFRNLGVFFRNLGVFF